MPRRASRQELPNISNEMGCVRCDGKAVLRKEDFMDKKAGLDGILAGGKERGDLMEHGGGLLRFLKPTRSALSVLVVESPAYLPKLREMMPAAALFAVTAELDDVDAPELQGLDVSWSFLDYRDTPLPFKRESFDYILADRCLETAGNPQDIAAGFGLFLRPTGCLLTSFLWCQTFFHLANNFIRDTSLHQIFAKARCSCTAHFRICIETTTDNRRITDTSSSLHK